MKSLPKTPDTARILDKTAAHKAQAVLEQMYGYFSFAPMPSERDQSAA